MFKILPGKQVEQLLALDTQLKQVLLHFWQSELIPSSYVPTTEQGQEFKEELKVLSLEQVKQLLEVVEQVRHELLQFAHTEEAPLSNFPRGQLQIYEIEVKIR